MKSYAITWLGNDQPPIPWERIPTLEIDCYPWYEGGEKQRTTAQVAISSENLHVRFQCEDRHIYAEFTRPNDPVSRDSCVEFFFAPEPETSLWYFNLEISCVGNILFGWGYGRDTLTRAPVDVIGNIEVKHTIPGPTKEESPDDNGWEIEARVSLSELQKVRPYPKPQRGTVWRGNFYRCGGKTDEQFASWMPIDLPTPEYHCPQFFGLLSIE